MLIDQAVLRSVFFALPESRRPTILRAIISDIETYAQLVCRGYADGDREAASRAGHALIGAAGNVGATEIVALITRIKHLNADEAPAELQALRSCVHRTNEQIESLAAVWLGEPPQ